MYICVYVTVLTNSFLCAGATVRAVTSSIKVTGFRYPCSWRCSNIYIRALLITDGIFVYCFSFLLCVVSVPNTLFFRKYLFFLCVFVDISTCCSLSFPFILTFFLSVLFSQTYHLSCCLCPLSLVSTHCVTLRWNIYANS